MKNKILSLFLALVMMVSVIPWPALASEVTPIHTQQDLKKLEDGGSFKLMKDIQLDETYQPVSIYGGSLDGNGHTITLNGKPFLTSISGGATVENLILKGSVSSASSVGTLSNRINNGIVRNCISYADVTYTGGAGSFWEIPFVGGLIGYTDSGKSQVVNCLYAGILNPGNADAYGAIMNDGEFATAKISNSVGVGVDRLGTDEMGTNELIADANDFVPENYLERFNANRGENGKEWIIGEDGRLTFQTEQAGEITDATEAELQALADAIATAEKVDKTKIYTADSWKAFQDARDTAQKLKDAQKKPQREVVEATEKLTEKTAALQVRGIDTVSSEGKPVVEVNQKNYKQTLKAPEAGTYYKLTEDITIDDRLWGGMAELNAVIDGNGFAVTLTGTPLYGTIGEEGVIQNLGILGNAQNGAADTGALAKNSYGLIINCWNRASVSSEGPNGIKKNTGGFVANLSSGGAVVNSYVAGRVSAKGSGSGAVGALAGRAEENTLIKYGYHLDTLGLNAVGSGDAVDSMAKSESSMKDKAFLAVLNAHKGTDGKEWTTGAEGWPHQGQMLDYQPDTEGVELAYTPKDGYGTASTAKNFNSADGLILTLEDIVAEPGTKNDTQYVGMLGYPSHQGEVVFVPQYVSNGQGKHTVFVSEDGGVEVTDFGYLEVAVCEKNSENGGWYGKELTRFKIVVNQSEIDELRVVPTGKYVTSNDDGTYHVAGTGSVQVNPQVKFDGKWKVAPATMCKISINGNVTRMGSAFYANAPGNVTVTTEAMGKQGNVEITSTYVPVEKITPGPSGTYVLHGRNANSDSLGDFLDLNLAYGAGTVIITPENASYGYDWTLESSDTSVAEYIHAMIRAVLPRKAGAVIFTATAKDPRQDKPVVGTSEVTLQYLNPVTNVEIAKSGLSVKENETMELPLTFTGPKSAEGYHVSEPGMTWSFHGDGEVEITRDSLGVLVRTDKEYCVANDRYKLTGIKEGIVTVTGTPVDQTGGAKPVTFTVTVETGAAEEPADNDRLAAEGAEGALKYMQKAYEGLNYQFGDEWSVFTFTRMGHGLTAQQKQDYLASIVKTYEKPKNADLKPTTIARVILTVTALGEDAANLNGVNLVDWLCQGKFMTDGSNEPIWALIALDSGAYEIPANAKWTRQQLLEEILRYQNPDNGGFGLVDNKQLSVDLTAMAVQALAGYARPVNERMRDEIGEKVKTAVDRALTYLKHEMNRNCDYGTSESISQVLIALDAMKMDPVDKENGFVKSAARNLVTALSAYGMDDGGFKHLLTDTKSQNMSTIQALMALESYRRVRAGEPSLFALASKESPNQSVQPDTRPTEPGTSPTAPTNPGTDSTTPGTQVTQPGGSATNPSAPNHNPPVTGDNSNMIRYFVIMAVTAGVIVVVLILTKKKKRG